MLLGISLQPSLCPRETGNTSHHNVYLKELNLDDDYKLPILCTFFFIQLFPFALSIGFYCYYFFFFNDDQILTSVVQRDSIKVLMHIFATKASSVAGLSPPPLLLSLQTERSWQGRMLPRTKKH